MPYMGPRVPRPFVEAQPGDEAIKSALNFTPSSTALVSFAETVAGSVAHSTDYRDRSVEVARPQS